MQNYNRIYDYIYEYWKEIYEIYGSHATPYLVTYYNLNLPSTVWDDEYLMGGAYHKIGDLSGLKWNKILLLPVYFIEETDTIFDAQESGLVNEGSSGMVIPYNYGITPYHNDMVKFDQTYIVNDTTNDNYALFAITGIQKQSDQDKTYWKCKLTVEQSRNELEMLPQVSNIYTYYEYDKKIHTISDAQIMTKMLSKSATLRSNVKNLYDENSGLYFI